MADQILVVEDLLFGFKRIKSGIVEPRFGGEIGFATMTSEI